jgi:hypothetical protein
MVEMKNFFDKIIILIFLIIVSSCTVYTRLSNPVDVLAITLSGDTIRIPIKEIKPNYIYNYHHAYPNVYNVNYPYLNHWYYPYDYNYNRWNHTVHYDRFIGGNSVNTNSSPIATRKHTSNSVSKKAKIQ